MRVLRKWSLELQFHRITDALRHALENKVDEVYLTDEGARKFMRMLSTLRIGHLVTFGQLLPGAIALALAHARDAEKSWMEAFL